MSEWEGLVPQIGIDDNHLWTVVYCGRLCLLALADFKAKLVQVGLGLFLMGEPGFCFSKGFGVGIAAAAVGDLGTNLLG